MKTLSFAVRNFKEIIRDPLNLLFGLGFPLVLILLLSAIQANIPVDLFKIEQLAPGIAVFGLSFMTLFSATIISKDRGSSFLQRLYATPLTPFDFILGYTLPIIPIAIAQSIICYAVAILLGLKITVNRKQRFFGEKFVNKSAYKSVNCHLKRYCNSGWVQNGNGENKRPY